MVQKIIAGLKDNPDFPNPPVSPEDLQTLLDDSIALEDAQVAARAAAQQATEAKQAGNDRMISAAKSVLNYAEDAVHNNDAKLAALGWSGRAEPTPLQAPDAGGPEIRAGLAATGLEEAGGRRQASLLSDRTAETVRRGMDNGRHCLGNRDHPE